MNYTQTQAALGGVDIYIIDQILKNKYLPNETILDAGCGEGRNLKWFYANGYNISGIDADAARLEKAKLVYPPNESQFQVGNLDSLPYDENEFHHVICSAVLHFAENEAHFFKMFSELWRVLKPNGILFIRMASDIGLDGNTPFLKESKTNRVGSYFLTRDTISQLANIHNFELVEPIKTTNVQDKRAMTTLVLRKM